MNQTHFDAKAFHHDSMAHFARSADMKKNPYLKIFVSSTFFLSSLAQAEGLRVSPNSLKTNLSQLESSYTDETEQLGQANGGLKFEDQSISWLAKSLMTDHQYQISAEKHEKIDDTQAIEKSMNEQMGISSYDVNFQAGEHGALFLIFRLPNAFSMRQEGRNQWSVSRSSANNMVNPMILESNSGGSRFQQIDAIGETTALTYERGDKNFEFSLSFRLFQLLAKPSLAIFPVSDGFIEKFHDWRGFNDPFARKMMGMNQVNVHLRDLNGHEFNAKNGQLYVLPLIIKLGAFKDLLKTETSKLNLNYGVHSALPLQKEFPLAGVGVYSNLNYSKVITQRWLFHLAAGVTFNMHKKIFDSYSPMDQAHMQSRSIQASIGISRFSKDYSSKTSLVFTMAQESASLRDSAYKAPMVQRFVDRQSSDAARKSDAIYGFSLIHETKKSTFQYGCFEDLAAYRLNGKDMKYTTGRNNRDFTCEIKYSRAL